MNTQNSESHPTLPISIQKDQSDFNKRMKIYQQQKNDRLKQQHLKKEIENQKEMQQLSFKPKINPNNQQRTLQDLHVWGKVAKEKLQKIRNEQLAELPKPKHRQRTSHSQTHLQNRFIELEQKEGTLITTNPAKVEDRLMDYQSMYKSNRKLKQGLLANPHNIKSQTTFSDISSKFGVSVKDSSRKLDQGKQIHIEELLAERNRLKVCIQKSQKTFKENDTD